MKMKILIKREQRKRVCFAESEKSRRFSSTAQRGKSTKFIDFDVAPDGVLHEGRRGESADYDTKDVYHYRRTDAGCDARRQSSNKDAC